jgi:hypothetical protein
MSRVDQLAKLRKALNLVYEAIEPLYPADAPSKLKLACVSYFYPTAARVLLEWAQVRAGAKICIMNPSSGAGTSASSDYTAELDRLLTAGVEVWGYVACTYGARPVADVVAEIHRLYQHYPKLKHGIFLDECPTADTAVIKDYLKAVQAAVKSHAGVLCINPGTTCPESFMALCDSVMIAETTAVKYMARVLPAWVKNYPAERFYHCVHDCAVSEMPAVVDRMRTNNAGLVYVTDKSYGELPTYWSALVSKVSA